MITRNLIIATVAMLIVSVVIGVLFFFASPNLRMPSATSYSSFCSC